MTTVSSPIPTANPTILAAGHTLSTDTWVTGVNNNNMLVLGPSGAGKTRHVLKPNLMQMNASYIVLDTKGVLCREMGPLLAAHGYRVQSINFSDLTAPTPACAETVGYNPLSFIRRNPVDGTANQQDILTVANALSPVGTIQDPFWDHSAASLLACMIAFVTDELPAEEQHLGSLVQLVNSLGDGATETLLNEVANEKPQGFCGSSYRRYRSLVNAEKTHSCIIGFVNEKCACLSFDEAVKLYTSPRQVDFARMGHEPHALFVTLSDVDATLEPLTNLFLTQALIELNREADAQPDGALPVPVRLYLDDFANYRVPNFSRAIATARSKNIWLTMLCQTVSQLETRYGNAEAESIIGNCSTQLVLGFQDDATARYYGNRANKTPSSLLETARNRAWLFISGEPGRLVKRYEVSEHPLYEESLACAADARAMAVEASRPPEGSAAAAEKPTAEERLRAVAARKRGPRYTRTPCADTLKVTRIDRDAPIEF